MQQFLYPLFFLLTHTMSAASGTDWPTQAAMMKPMAALFQQPLQGYQLFRPQEQPLVLVLQFPDLTHQARAMNRIAAFVEKEGAPKDRALRDKELRAFIAQTSNTPERFFIGHDYRAQDLARFFNVTRRDKITLNNSEKDLLTLLTSQGFLAINAAKMWQATTPEQALITIPAMGRGQKKLTYEEWWLTLRHELSHGEFFTNPDYQQYCKDRWASLPAPVQQVFRDDFASMGYDPANEFLMINEWQAFLWEPSAGFVDASLRKYGTSLEKLQAAFLSGIMRADPPITQLFHHPTFHRMPDVPDPRPTKKPRSLEKRSEPLGATLIKLQDR